MENIPFPTSTRLAESVHLRVLLSLRILNPWFTKVVFFFLAGREPQSVEEAPVYLYLASRQSPNGERIVSRLTDGQQLVMLRNISLIQELNSARAIRGTEKRGVSL